MQEEKQVPLLQDTEPGVDAKAEDRAVAAPARKHVDTLRAAALILTWMIISTTVILWNTHILTNAANPFPYPITLSCVHMAFQTIACKLLMRFAPQLMGVKQREALPLPASQPSSPKSDGSFPPASTYGAASKYTWAKTILPIGILFAASLVLSNAAYLFLSVPFIQMIKAGSPIAVMITSFAFGLKAFSFKLVGIILTISLGVLIASVGEASFNLIGFAIQVVAIMVEATRLSLIQLLMQGAGLTPMTSLNAFAPVCFVTLAVLILPIEGFAALQALPQVGLSVLLSNAALTFALNISAIYLVAISSLVLSLSKVIKDIALVLASIVLMGHAVTSQQWAGYGVALIGLFLYKFYAD